MAYSKSPDTLKARLPLLSELAKNNECRWPCKPDSERRLAQRIREALWIAKNVAPDDFPALAEAKENFSIHETGEGAVIAKRLERPAPEPLPVKTTPRKEPVRVGGTKSYEEIKQIISQSRGNALPLHFPNADLSKEELLSFHRWLTENFDYLLFYADGSMTIHEPSEELNDLAFHPDDLE